jgi:hypothetical protein
MVGFGTRISTNEKKQVLHVQDPYCFKQPFFFHEISSCEIKISLVANCMILSLRTHSPKFEGGKNTNHRKSPDSYVWFK